MRFEVPQFIEIESKIFGPLTWKEFVYVVGGAGTIFILYSTLPLVFVVLLGFPIGAFAAALAFYRYNDRPFVDILEAAFTYITGAKLYLWRKEEKPIEHKPDAPQASYTLPTSSSLASKSRQLELHALQHKR